MAPSRTTPPPPPAYDSKTPGLTTDQLAFYHENGYLIIPDALDPSSVSYLLDETKRMLDNISLADHPMTKFSTGQGDSKHVGDDYFLNSGDKIRFFFEEGPSFTCPSLSTPLPFPPSFHPLQPNPQTDTPRCLLPHPPHHLLHRPSQSINKIGHSLHTLSPLFARTTLSPTHASIARALGFHDPRVLQSMVICKQPEIGGAVPPHQDSSFLYTDPPSAVGFWIALEDARVGNGCLSVVGGSQRRMGVGRRFVRLRVEEGGGTGFVRVEGGRFPSGEGKGRREGEGEGGDKIGDGGKGVGEGGEEDYTLVEVKAGTLVLIHGNLLHKSERNLSGRSRLAYTFHVIEGENAYDERNWLQPPEEGFTRLYREEE